MTVRALILVDIQNDFVPGGALAVKEGDKIAAKANLLMSQFDVVVATQDWHPAKHGSFAANHEGKNVGEFIDLDGLNQILWPTHCVEGSEGAEFVKDLATDKIDKVFQKGTDPQIDSYSGFFDNGHKKGTGLKEYLEEKNIGDVYVLGLATDYCVKFTALDANKLGFNTFLVKDASRGVDIQAGDVDKAIKEMEDKGIQIVDSDEVRKG
jgi:nicotinamidase/pyrazinamidase